FGVGGRARDFHRAVHRRGSDLDALGNEHREVDGDVVIVVVVGPVAPPAAAAAVLIVAARLPSPERADDHVLAVLARFDPDVVGVAAPPALHRRDLDPVTARLADGDFAIEVVHVD